MKIIPVQTTGTSDTSSPVTAPTPNVTVSASDAGAFTRSHEASRVTHVPAPSSTLAAFAAPHARAADARLIAPTAFRPGDAFPPTSLEHPVRVVPFIAFDPQREPVFLVHGLHPQRGSMDSLAQRLHDAGRQVFIVTYEDDELALDDVARELAAQMTRIRSTGYGHSINLDVVAHSMGGLVARSALAHLNRTDFNLVRLRTADSPLAGAAKTAPTFLQKIAAVFMRLFGMRSVADMLTSSRFHVDIRTPLQNVDIRHHMSRLEARFDVLSLPEFADDELVELANVLTGDQRETTLTSGLRNLLAALRDDNRFEQFHGRLQRELISIAHAHDIAGVVRRAYEATMPRFAGDHNIHIDTAARNDFVDNIVSEFSVPRARSAHRPEDP